MADLTPEERAGLRQVTATDLAKVKQDAIIIYSTHPRRNMKLFENRPTPRQMWNRRKWRKALLSGKYAQITDDLYRPVGDYGTEDYDVIGYCCLGVACETFGFSRNPTNPGTYFHPKDGTIMKGTMDDDLFTDLFGLSSSTGTHGPQQSFTYLNDYGDKTFVEIAAAIPTKWTTVMTSERPEGDHG